MPTGVFHEPSHQRLNYFVVYGYEIASIAEKFESVGGEGGIGVAAAPVSDSSGWAAIRKQAIVAELRKMFCAREGCGIFLLCSFCVFQKQNAGIGGRNCLLGAAVGALHNFFDAFEDVGFEVGIDFYARGDGTGDRVRWNFKIDGGVIGEQFAARFGFLFAIRADSDFFGDGVAEFGSCGVNFLRAIFNRG